MKTKINPSIPRPSNPIGLRLKFEMKKRGISSAELAKRADVKTSFIYDVINGKSSNPSTVKLARVADSLGVSLGVLAGAYNASITPAPMLPNDYVIIPRINTEMAPDGKAAIVTDNNAEPFLFYRTWVQQHMGVNPASLRLLVIRGDSMEPTLYHNDIVMVDVSSRMPSPPGLFVLFDGFGLIVRRLEPFSSGAAAHIRAIPDNPQYNSYELTSESISIVGRVSWFSRAV